MPDVRLRLHPCLADRHDPRRRHRNPGSPGTSFYRQRVDRPSTGPRTASPSTRPTPNNWKIEPFHHYADTCSIIIPDFEAPLYHAWKDSQYEAFAKLIGDVRARKPDVLIGCWGVGVLKSSFRIFDSFYEGKPTGVIDLNGAKQWRDKYDHPPTICTRSSNGAISTSAILRSIGSTTPNRPNCMPSCRNGSRANWPGPTDAQYPVHLDPGRIRRRLPAVPIPLHRRQGKTRLEDIKHQVPASSTYALSLFGHCVMDGLQCWEIGTRYSEDLARLLRLARPRTEPQTHNQRCRNPRLITT